MVASLTRNASASAVATSIPLPQVPHLVLQTFLSFLFVAERMRYPVQAGAHHMPCETCTQTIT